MSLAEVTEPPETRLINRTIKGPRLVGRDAHAMAANNTSRDTVIASNLRAKISGLSV